ncbi:chromosome condensation complex Condensin, subunit G [Savitreella phatthalungensis]
MVAPARDVVTEVLHEVQQTRSSRKNAVVLKQHLLQTSGFTRHYLNCLNHALLSKRTDNSADRVMRFTALFISLLEAPEGSREATLFGDFSKRVVQHLMRGLEARDKSVRYRCTQGLAYIMSSGLSEIDEDLFEALQTALVKRVRDKEASVRVQAVIALARFQADLSDDADDSEDESAEKISEVLLHLLQHDPAAEVRRAVLTHLNQSSATLPFLLERARDTDSVLRKQIYTTVMPAVNGFKPLSISKRNKLLKWGLRDRDENVRHAAQRMFGVDWLNLAGGSILELLQRLDVTNSVVSEDAVNAFFETRYEFIQAFVLDDNFWQELNPESSFLVRCLNDYCAKQSIDIADRLPELSTISSLINKHVAQAMRLEDEDKAEAEFVVENLLRLVSRYDLSDEIGRRRIVSNVREILRHDLSDTIVVVATELLAKLTFSEHEYAELVREVVTDLFDKLEVSEIASSSADEESSTAAPAATADVSHDDDDTLAARRFMITLKCLGIVATLLANVGSSPKSNAALESLIGSVIQPAIRSHQAPVREKAIECLGLVSLLDAEIALESLEMFMVCYARGDDELQVTALRIVTDIMLCQPSLVEDRETALLRVYLKAFSSDSEDVQATAALACSKLLLFGRIVPGTENAVGLLKEMCGLYYDSASADRPALRQALTYFFPCFALSSPANMRSLATVVVPVLKRVAKQRRRFSEDGDEAAMTDGEGLSLSAVAAQLLDWTNPLKLVSRNAVQSFSSTGEPGTDDDIQLSVANELLKRLHLSDPPREEYRALVSALNRCYLPPTLPIETLQSLAAAADRCTNACSDATSRRGLQRFATSVDRLQADVVNQQDEVKDIDGETHNATMALDKLNIAEVPMDNASASILTNESSDSDETADEVTD